MTKLKTYNWALSVCNRDFILCDWDILSNKSDIKERCSMNCEQRHTCNAIADLLRNGNWKRAEELLWEHLSSNE